VQELLDSKAQFVLFKFSTNLTDSVVHQWIVEDSVVFKLYIYIYNLYTINNISYYINII
jgi:hypothetical protein